MCKIKHELGIALHNLGGQKKRAVRLLEEVLVDDPADHVVSECKCMYS